MAKRIVVIGTGYVGLIQAVGLADFGNYVTAVDIRPDVIDSLKHGAVPIFEHGLAEYLERTRAAGRIEFTTDVESALREPDVVFLAVGTPSNHDGSADLSQIDDAVDMVARSTSGLTVVVTKSTVPVGTNRSIHERLTGLSGQSEERRFIVASNPEFLREGKAVHDFFHPDRVVVGLSDPASNDASLAKEILTDVYRPLNLISVPFVWTNFETAELVKYASNAFLATKITYINQMANLAEAVGADIHLIARTMGMDGRISPKFLHPGPGYGGSCFPKDTRALVSTAERNEVEMGLLRAVIQGNERQKELTAEKARKLLGGSLEGKTVCILGVTFKAETDDVRESPAISVVEKLLRWGARVRVHDPKGTPGFASIFENRVEYGSTVTEAVRQADLTMILTEWNEYRNLDFGQVKQSMRGDVLVDARNIMDPVEARAHGFQYHGTGR